MKNQPINNFFVPHSVLEDEKFYNQKPCTQLLYIHLCKLTNRYSDENGWFWRSLKSLSRDTGLNIKTVIRAKKELLENKFIDVEAGYYEHSKKRTYDYYRLNGFRFKSSDKNGNS